MKINANRLAGWLLVVATSALSLVWLVAATLVASVRRGRLVEPGIWPLTWGTSVSFVVLVVVLAYSWRRMQVSIDLLFAEMRRRMEKAKPWLPPPMPVYLGVLAEDLLPPDEVAGGAPAELRASEALYAFCGWLTTRAEITRAGGGAECDTLAERVHEFCDAQHLLPPRDRWERAVRRMPDEADSDEIDPRTPVVDGKIRVPLDDQTTDRSRALDGLPVEEATREEAGLGRE